MTRKKERMTLRSFMTVLFWSILIISMMAVGNGIGTLAIVIYLVYFFNSPNQNKPPVYKDG